MEFNEFIQIISDIEYISLQLTNQNYQNILYERMKNSIYFINYLLIIIMHFLDLK